MVRLGLVLAIIHEYQLTYDSRNGQVIIMISNATISKTTFWSLSHFHASLL